MTKTEINTLYTMIHEERRSLQRRWRMTPSGPGLLECQAIILHWREYRNNSWGNHLEQMQPEILECRRGFDRVGVLSDGAAELSMWLDIAAGDVEKRLAAKAAMGTGTAVSIAGEEDDYDD